MAAQISFSSTEIVTPAGTADRRFEIELARINSLRK
jgi:hypothetical protein